MTTTAERIENIIRDVHEQDRWGRVVNTNSDKAAETIAAEIDALTAQLAEARALADKRGNAAIVDVRAYDNTIATLAAERDEAYTVLQKRTAERDEAQAQIAALTLQADAWIKFDKYWTAWNDSRRIMGGNERWPAVAEIEKLRIEAEAAAARAREAGK
jgi:hypothetical protein